MNTVYRIKEGVEWIKLKDLNYEVFDTNPISFQKIIPQDINGELCQNSLKQLYNNPQWFEKIYFPHKKVISKVLGLKYKKGNAIISPEFEKILTSWKICIESSDGWVGFSSGDPFDHNVYYATKHLDAYCADEIKALKDADLIEIIEVEDSNA